MKTLVAKLSCALFFVVRGENTLTGTHTIGALESRPECSIEQCLNTDIYNTECATAASQGCGYGYGWAVSGGLTGSDICAFPGAATETETPLWLKLDLNAAGIMNLAEWFTEPCAYVAGALTFQTANPRSGSDLNLTGHGSPSLSCEGSVDSEIPGVLAAWRTDSNRIELTRDRDTSPFLGWDGALFDGKHAIILNAGSSTGFTETAVGAITGFVAEDWRIICISNSVGTLPPVSPFRDGAVSLTDVTGSCVAGCGAIDSVAAAEECIAAAELGCDFSATYTLSNANVMSQFCQVDDKTRVSEELIFPMNLWRNANSSGSLFLDIGSKPAETCQIEVALLTSVDLLQPACGLADAEEAGRQTFTVDPNTRSMELTQLPDNFAGVAITADKDWRFCGGSVNAFRVEESLTSTLHITPLTPSDTPSDTTHGFFDDGTPAALTLAAVSFASLVLVL
eukprot:Gregarina_sp_Pseudo_9__669@NODE_1425_length_1613_cov_21_543202_g1323_i0_p1_GENE_NODE_1425_length_1613_cov_21_543202_g1323_i0NODE_1425_length_1613_cov_21_543202_g1323_i0_p1_ORF_typecomplete_len453_score84_54_NODE_1425_length_1613_cov_21_543202_g1323_i01911549